VPHPPLFPNFFFFLFFFFFLNVGKMSFILVSQTGFQQPQTAV
jgi:hypothetical protein